MSINQSKRDSFTNSKTGGRSASQFSAKRSSSIKSNGSKRRKSDASKTKSVERSGSTTAVTVQNELEWGLSYRALNLTPHKKPLKPQHSPISIPFKICRYIETSVRRTVSEAAAKAETVSVGPKSETTVKLNPTEQIDTTKMCTILSSLPPFQICKSKTKHRKKRSKRTKQNKAPISLLDRSALPQNKYMELLSVPHEYSTKDRAKIRKKCNCKCLLEPCSPRLVQMAIPKKRRVWETWKLYQDSLPADMLVRFDQILRSGNNNLEPREARYYFKKIDREKRKDRRKRKKANRRKKLLKKTGDQLWLSEEICHIADLIVEYIKRMPLFALNYEQMLISDEIISFLSSQQVFGKVRRESKSPYQKTLVESSDKIAKWIKGISHAVDIRPLDSREELTLLEVSSMEDLLDEEEGEEGEFEKDYGEFEGEAESVMEIMAKKIIDKQALLYGMFEDEGSVLDFLGDLDEDILEKLIRILSNCSQEFKEQAIHSTDWPHIKYHHILDKLKQLRDGKFEVFDQKSFLEQLMIDWAMRNEPDKVDDKILDKIHETANMLDLWLRQGIDMDTLLTGIFGGPETQDSLFPDEGEGGMDLDGFGKLEELGQLDYDSSALDDQYGEEQLTEDMEDKGSKTDLDKRGQSGEADQDALQAAVDELEDDFGGEAEELGGELGKSMGEGEELEEEGLEEEELEEESLGEEESEGELGEEESEGELGEEESEGELTEEEKLAAAQKGLELFEQSGLISKDSLLTLIKGHKPPVVFEHSPGTVCCLSLKVWAVWLLEIAHNAHNWTKWICSIIRRIRQYASIIRGDETLPNGEKKVLYKEEWRRFTAETEQQIIAWRQYKSHVGELSDEIIENFHGKPVNCCPKCLQDHLIKNVVTAHETLQALAEAINCAEYWHRCLDKIVEQTSTLTGIELTESKTDLSSESSSESSFEIVEIEELVQLESEESLYEIEELLQ